MMLAHVRQMATHAQSQRDLDGDLAQRGRDERRSDVGSAAREPVLVTGMHRSGTTWVAEMLCASGRFVHFDEPLNARNRHTLLRDRVGAWYAYLSHENEETYLDDYRDALGFRPHPIRDLRKAWLGSPRTIVRIPGRWSSYALGRMQRRRVLLKDPFAVFSIDWFRRRLGCRVVVTVRHPLAVVSSLKRLGYAFDFRDLLGQPRLMSDRLEQYRPDMESLLSSPSDVVDQGSLLWRIVYEAVAQACATDHDASVVVVRHEDLSQRPLEDYAALYETLDLQFTDEARRVIQTSTNAANPTESSVRNPSTVRLDSRANLGNWRHRLTEEEVERIMTRVQPVVGRFYPERLEVGTR